MGSDVRILVDHRVPDDKRQRIEEVVMNAIGSRADAGSLVVSLVKLNPGRGWSVFINDLQDAPLVDTIQTALKKAGF